MTGNGRQVPIDNIKNLVEAIENVEIEDRLRMAEKREIEEIEKEFFECYKCEEEKQLSKFYIDRSRPNKHRPYCKECDNKRRLEYYYEQKEHELDKPLRELIGEPKNGIPNFLK